MEIYARVDRPSPGNRDKVILERNTFARLRPTLFYDDGAQWLPMEQPGQIFSVKDYGAMGDGQTDDTAAINRAYAAMALFGGALYFPAGTYLVTNLTPWTTSIKVYGDGWQNTFIRTTVGTGDVATISKGGITVMDLQFGATVARTAGAYLNITNLASSILVRDVFMTGHFIGIDCAATIVRIRDCQLRSPTPATGIGIRFTGAGADLVCRGVVMDAAAGSQGAYGILVNGCQDLKIEGCSIIHQGTDLGLIAATGFVVSSVWGLNTFFDTAVNGLIVAPTGTGAVVRCHFTQCWFSSHTGYGSRISAGGTTIVDTIEFTACQWYLNTNDGILVDAGPLNVRINGGVSGNNGGAGAKFLGTDFSVKGARFGNVGALAGNGTYGVDVAAVGCEHFDVSGNDLRGNTTAPYRNLSTGVDWTLGQNLPDITSPHLRGQFLRGDLSGAAVSRFMIQTSTVNGNSTMTLMPNGTALIANFFAVNSSNLAGPYVGIDIRATSTACQVGVRAFNAAAVLPLQFVVNGVNLTIDTNGNLIRFKGMADQSYSRQVPVTGFTITIADNIGCLILDPAGVLATGTITMPANPIDGSEVSITTSQNINALTVNANAGQTIVGAQGFINPVSPLRYIYQLSGTKWYRLV